MLERKVYQKKIRLEYDVFKWIDDNSVKPKGRAKEQKWKKNNIEQPPYAKVKVTIPRVIMRTKQDRLYKVLNQNHSNIWTILRYSREIMGDEVRSLRMSKNLIRSTGARTARETEKEQFWHCGSKEKSKDNCKCGNIFKGQPFINMIFSVK